MSEGKVTTETVKAMKEKGERIAVLTAYDYPTARLMDSCGIDIILVGDSVGMVVLGYQSTLPVTVEEMIHHTKAVSRAKPRALVVGDMPFMSFQAGPADALKNAGEFIKKGSCEAVKIEGGKMRCETVKLLVENGIPVMGHIGLTPQSILSYGGYKVQGRISEQAAQLKEDALALENAGCFSIVLEAVPWKLSKEITESLKIPTIGIGAGPHCDGQVLVVHDMLGMFLEFTPKFVKRYANLASTMKEAFSDYVREVKSGKFPDLEHSYE
ncbi:MAG: 3-methyl-2-oxobutanoate hydroxymethyltransferase [Candidatus Eisenbacteria bacterium]|nr:3-methyl-2-oxobutanoate hydroxymethyltransferase [Candidatus Eisenbacteria bacterium]